MRSPLRPFDRRGVALPLALFTLVIAAVMITAVFYVGRLEQRMGYSSLAGTQAFEAAELGVTAVMDAWSTESYNLLTPGGSVTLPATSVGHNASYNAVVRRLNNSQFLIQSEGRFFVGATPITRRQVGRVVRLNPPDIQPGAAVVSRTGLTITGTTDIDGRDHIPGGWSGCSVGSDAPAVTDSSGNVVTTGPCTGQACLTGSPRVNIDPSVTSQNFNQFGPISFHDLSLSADKIVSGSLVIGPSYNAGPTCRLTDLVNWGAPEDPSGACGSYFPVIYAPGDLDLSGGTGQGLLLVDGNLTFSGNARFYGAIVVNGSVNLTSGEIHGTLLVQDFFGTGATINGTRIEFSRCAITKASNGAARPIPLRDRGWVQLY